MNDVASKYFDNPAFREYVFLLVELERLIREDRDESPEGDAIRDAMDAPGDRLGSEEVKAVSAFAADLTRLSEQYASILLPTERPRASPDAPVGKLPSVTGPEPRPRELT